jgi:hypothetical protein
LLARSAVNDDKALLTDAHAAEDAARPAGSVGSEEVMPGGS